MPYTWMQRANWPRVLVFWKGILDSVSSHCATLISHLAKAWMQYYHEFPSNECGEWASVRGIGLLTAPGEFHGLTADLANLIRVTRLARNLSENHPVLTLASCVSLGCSSRNNGFKTRGYSPVQWALKADNEEHGFTTTMPSENKTFRMATMSRHLQEQVRDAISRAQHTTRKQSIELPPGTWVMYFRRGKVTFYDGAKKCRLEHARRVERLLRILRESRLCGRRSQEDSSIRTIQASAKRSHRRLHRKRTTRFPRNDRGSPSCPKFSRR